MTAPVPIRPSDEPIRSHAHANVALDDAPYIGYVLAQMFKLGIALLAKRWPQLR